MKHLGTFILVVGLLFLTEIADAQCAMCKAVAESDVSSGAENAREGINNGILYLMGIPYLLLMLVGFMLFKKYKSTPST